MRIVVLVKTVPDGEARMKIRDGGRALKMERRWELNYFDSVAVEKAVQIKESLKGSSHCFNIRPFLGNRGAKEGNSHGSG